MSAHFEPAQKACSVLGAFLRHRGLVPLLEPLRPAHVKEGDLVEGLTPGDAVKSILDTVARWEVVAARRSAAGALSHLTYIVVITGQSAEAHKAKSLEGRFLQAPANVARMLQGAGIAAPGLALSEAIVIAPDDVVDKKPLAEVVADVREQMPDVHIGFHRHVKFSTVVPEQKLVPRHEVAPADEVDEFLRLNYMRRDELPGIPASDAAAIWCGARRGQVVRVMRLSETVGSYIPVYRLVR